MRTSTLTLLVLALAAPPAEALAQSHVGQRVRVSGEWDGRALVAEKIRQRDPRKDRRRASIGGRISTLNIGERSLSIGPVTIGWTDATAFAGLRATDLRVGLGVEATVAIEGAGLRALRLEPKDADARELSLLAVVEHSRETRDGSSELQLLGVPVFAPRSLSLPQLTLTRRPDERRPSDQLTRTVGNGYVTVGGEIETALGGEADPSLGEDDEDTLTLESELQLELTWRIAPRAVAFAEAKFADERELAKQGSGRKDDTFAERGETWLYLRAPGDSGFALQIGRQALSEDREWWWDSDLDALRIHWDAFPFAAEIGVARELGAVSTLGRGLEADERGILREFARARWSWSPGHVLEGFALHQSDASRAHAIGEVIEEDREDESDANLWWAGARATGEAELGSRLVVSYWGDFAWVTGREELFAYEDAASGGSVVTARSRPRVNGWGFDVGATLRTRLPLEAGLTAGVAIGSGRHGAPAQGFRQTGLQDNNSHFGGVEGFRYYGQALDPELSNLGVASLGIGFPLLSDSSLDLVYHRYWQHRRAPFLRDAGLDRDPSGVSRQLGDGFDLVVGLQEWEHLELEIVIGAFHAGRAFAGNRGEIALDGFVRVGWNF